MQYITFETQDFSANRDFLLDFANSFEDIEVPGAELKVVEEMERIEELDRRQAAEKKVSRQPQRLDEFYQVKVDETAYEFHRKMKREILGGRTRGRTTNEVRGALAKDRRSLATQSTPFSVTDLSKQTLGEKKLGTCSTGSSASLATLGSATVSSKLHPNRWSTQEEIILVGLVTDANLLYGGQIPWEDIKHYYDEVSLKFTTENDLSRFPIRTTVAIKKHYRVMLVRAREGEIDKNYWYRAYHHKWLSSEYNKENRLIDFLSLRQFSN